MTAVKDKLITAEELKVAYDDLHVSPLIVSIPSGQWSGSGNDYYFTVSASNVTSNSILVPNYDKTSASYLNGPVWCVPASGSFTVHTTAIPSGTVNILIQFVGIMGEAEYQVLADVYSKSQTYSKSEAVAKADIVDNLTSTDPNKVLAAPQGKALNDKIGNLHCLYAWNTTTINVDIEFAPATNKSATGILVNGNQSVFALLKLDTAPSVTVLGGTKNFTISLSGSEFTITADGTLWGATMILWLSN